MEIDYTEAINNALGYVDFDYRGYTQRNSVYGSKELLFFNLVSTSAFPSTLLYPFGDNTKVYPTGSLIIIPKETKKIKIKIRWKNETGVSKIVLVTKALQEIAYSGIFIDHTSDFVVQETIIDCFPDALYMLLKTESGMLDVSAFSCYQVVYSTASSSGSILLENEKAIVNAFKMWLFSKKGDYYRQPSKGGILDFVLGLPLTENSAEFIRSKLLEEIRTNFFNLKESDVKVKMDTSNLKFIITVYLVDVYNKFIAPVSFELNPNL